MTGPDALWREVAGAIGRVTGTRFVAERVTGMGGGCINSAYRVEGGGRRFFVKLNDAARLAMFEAEADGLSEIAATATVRVPEPVCSGVAGGHSFLALELLELGNGRDAAPALGEQLAAMHRVSAARFGWKRDNTIGATPQANAWCDDWIAFWRDRRLGFQLGLAGRRDIGAKALRDGQALMERLPEFFAGYSPSPSLLHGDLWGGNWAVLSSGEPVIFDPAVYYGDREADIAMTELFGGFPAAFHAAYQAAWPLDPGYALRRDLYNLYHVLNHYNLFGGGYGGQAEGMMRRLLGQAK